MRIPDEDSLTILKYTLDGTVGWHVMDKFDESDEPKRLSKMIAYSEKLADVAQYENQFYAQLWIKTCPVFPTR